MPRRTGRGPVLVSACLLGVACRYDGRSCPDAAALRLAAAGRAVPVCPEQLGGLGTPRPAAEIVGDRVLARDGADVTAAFERGAQETLRLAEALGARRALFRDGSPSCGVTRVRDGTFGGGHRPGCGVTTARLRRAGIEVRAAGEAPESGAAR